MKRKMISVLLAMLMVFMLQPAAPTYAADFTGTITTSEEWSIVVSTIFAGNEISGYDNLYCSNLVASGGGVVGNAHAYLNGGGAVYTKMPLGFRGNLDSTSYDGSETLIFSASSPGTYSFEILGTDHGVTKTISITVTGDNCTMTFDAEGGSVVNPVTVSNNTAVAAPTAPTKAGYTFGGWYDGDNGTGSAISFPYTLTVNKTVYAKWTANPYTLTFDSEGGSTINAITQAYNTQVAAPTAPTKTGYTFVNWYDGDNGTGNVVSFPHTLIGDKTVYAKWAIEQDTMTFDSEGGSVVDAVTVDYNTPVAAPTPPTKSGYTFGGWYDGDNGTGSAISFPYTLTANKTVYAKWTANPYTLTFDSEGGSTINAITQAYNTQVAAPSVPTRTGYTFVNWYDGDNGTGNVVSFPHTLTGDKTVYAKWAVEQDSMTFDAEGGSVVNAVTVNYNTPVAAPTAPTKSGYTFGGWYDGDNGTGSAISFPYTLTVNKTVYAKWTANPYTLTFDSEGGSTINAITQAYNTQVAAPTVPTRTGYTFVNWYDGDNGTGNVVSFPHTLTGDKTVYAKWAVEQDTLTFDAEGGSVVDAVTVNYNTPVAAPTAPTKSGYTFGGWYDGDNGTGSVISFPYTLTVNKTVYAKWTANPYTLTFDSEGGSTINAITQAYNTQVAAPSVPTKTGYTFVNWYDGDNGTGNVVSLPHTLTGDKTVYAKWAVEQDTITFDAEGGSVVDAVTVDYNTPVAAPTAPTKSGYTFGGWYDGDNGTGSVISFPYTLTANKTVYAKWTANLYTVTFDPGTGTVNTPSQIKRFGATYGKGSNGVTDEPMPTPTQTGYIFSGWHTGMNGAGSLITGTTTVTSDSNHTLYAKWVVEQHTLTFDSEGGSIVNAITQDYNSQVAAPIEPTRAGYTFDGWYDGDNGTGNTITFPYALTANKTIYAKWTINTYVITYKNNHHNSDTSVYTTQSVVGIRVATAPVQPIRAGYLFGGWYTNDTCSTPWNFKSDRINADLVLYAKWTVAPVIKYTITYASNGATSGTVPVDSNEYISGSATRVSANTGSLAKAGFTFGGWSSGGTTYGVGETITISGDVTLTAVWTAVPETYTAAYSKNYTGSGVYTSQSGITSGSILVAPADPTRIGYTFIGWFKDASCINPWNFNVDTVKSNMTLYAKWAASTYTVSGSVVDDQVIPVSVSGASVKVIQGNVQFGSTSLTDSGGNFAITGIPDGIYNLVVTRDNQEVTVFITVNGGNYTYGGFIILPSGNKNSSLDVIGSETPNVVVDNLHHIFSDANVYGATEQNIVSSGGTVEIKLTVQKNDASENKAAVLAAISNGGHTTGTILDIDLTKTSTSSGGASEASQIRSTRSLIKIIIPLPTELQGKSRYVIYRAHDYGSGVVTDAITTTANANGESIDVSTDKTQITAYLKFFSTYAIAYANSSTPPTPSNNSSGGGSSSISSYVIKATAGAGGSISPSGSQTVTMGQSKTFTIAADQGFKVSNVLVDGKSVGTVDSYTFMNVIASHTIEIIYVKDQGLPYYLDQKGDVIFIGFASNVDGAMKYIAPQGKAVLFKGNMKNFTDIAGHWAKPEIDFVTERELFSGTGSNTFSPETGMTRAMFTAVLGRLYESSYGNPELASKGSKFSDADYNAYYGSYMDWAVQNNIVTGVGRSQFEPDRKITREEMAVVLYQFAKYLKASDLDANGSKLSYLDASGISQWAKDGAKYCQQTGIITGRKGGNFVPQGVATRAEVAAILHKFIEHTVQKHQ